VNWNYPASVEFGERFSDRFGFGKKDGNWMKAAFLAVAVLATLASVLFSAFSSSATAHASKTKDGIGRAVPPRKSLLSRNPLDVAQFLAADVFRSEPGQTAAPVKFLARGSGYGLFLTADEAVLELQRPAAGHPSSVAGLRPPERERVR